LFFIVVVAEKRRSLYKVRKVCEYLVIY